MYQIHHEERVSEKRALYRLENPTKAMTIQDWKDIAIEAYDNETEEVKLEIQKLVDQEREEMTSARDCAKSKGLDYTQNPELLAKYVPQS